VTINTKCNYILADLITFSSTLMIKIKFNYIKLILNTFLTKLILNFIFELYCNRTKYILVNVYCIHKKKWMVGVNLFNKTIKTDT